MTQVQRGRGGWASSGRRAARWGALAVLGVTLALAGCSSKKTKPVGAENAGGSNLGESGQGGSSLNQLQNGTLGSGTGGPLSDIHFAYNAYTIEPQDGSILKSNASWLEKNPQTRVQVEGHCDERGSEEYNIALGAKREGHSAPLPPNPAQAAKDYLVTLGIPASRISTISYGKELPLCTDHDESCWAQNRRDHFVVSQ
jgi:peptidoglycan-associated lipoprotein